MTYPKLLTKAEPGQVPRNFLLRMPDKLYRKLQKEAKKESLSLAEHIRRKLS